MSAVEYVRSAPTASELRLSDLSHFFFGRHGLGDGLGDGDGLTLGEVVGFGLDVFGGAVVGAVVVVRVGAVVLGAADVVRVVGPLAGPGYWTGPLKSLPRVAVGVAVAVGVGVGWRVASTDVGLSLTSTLRVSWSSAPNVSGTTDSGSAWNPMTARSPVAADASATMTTLDSTGPRATALRVTVATSP